MPSAATALLQYESGQEAVAMSALVDSGDATKFTSSKTLWSQRSGFAPDVRPDGLITGGGVIPAVSGSNNVVDVAALTGYIQGVLKSISAATDQSITRPATDVAKVNSITATAAGAIAVVAGTDGGSATFSESRGSAGGPPHIPVTSIELAQVRVTSSGDAPITAAEIFATVGVHMERYDYPTYTISHYGGYVTMGAALPLIHTGDEPKNVYASYAGPIFQEVPRASNFVPSGNAHSVNSEQVYGPVGQGTVGSVSSTLNQGSFSVKLNDGVTDPLVKLADLTLWFKFFPDRAKSPHILDQGVLGLTQSFPAGDNIAADCTISTETAATRVDA